MRTCRLQVMDEFAEQLRQIRAALRKGKLDERQRQEKENESLAQISTIAKANKKYDKEINKKHKPKGK